MALGAAPAAVELLGSTGLFSGIDGGIDSAIELRLLECAPVREFNSCSPAPARTTFGTVQLAAINTRTRRITTA